MCVPKHAWLLLLQHPNPSHLIPTPTPPTHVEAQAVPFACRTINKNFIKLVIGLEGDIGIFREREGDIDI